MGPESDDVVNPTSPPVIVEVQSTRFAGLCCRKEQGMSVRIMMKYY